MEVQNLVSLTKLIAQQQLQETLKTETTDLSRYENDYKLFKEYCAEMNQVVSGEMLLYYLHHSVKDQQVKKNTFNRRYFACKKMMAIDGMLLTDDEIDVVKQLRKLYRTEALADKARAKGKQAIDSNELLEIIHRVKDIRAKAVLMVQFYTGCRPSEMVLLKIGDFDLEARDVRVYLQKQKESIEKRLPLVCVNAIRDYMKKYGLVAESYFIGRVDKYDNYHNKQITLSGYNDFLHHHTKLSAYNFRKTLVSHMHRNGADLETIRKQSGHSSTRTISEHYLKVDKSMVDQYL